jgi:hypothetical protein
MSRPELESPRPPDPEVLPQATEVPVKSLLDGRTKQAERYLNRAGSTIDTTNKLLIAWLLTMPALWIYRLEPAVHEVRELGKETQEKQQALYNVHKKIDEDRAIAV